MMRISFGSFVEPPNALDFNGQLHSRAAAALGGPFHLFLGVYGGSIRIPVDVSFVSFLID